MESKGLTSSQALRLPRRQMLGSSLDLALVYQMVSSHTHTHRINVASGQQEMATITNGYIRTTSTIKSALIHGALPRVHPYITHMVTNIFSPPCLCSTLYIKFLYPLIKINLIN